jgi:hypothetical protein
LLLSLLFLPQAGRAVALKAEEISQSAKSPDIPAGASGASRQLRNLFRAPELDEGLIGDIETARMIADMVEYVLGHAQRDGLR